MTRPRRRPHPARRHRRAAAAASGVAYAGLMLGFGMSARAEEAAKAERLRQATDDGVGAARRGDSTPAVDLAGGATPASTTPLPSTTLGVATTVPGGAPPTAPPTTRRADAAAPRVTTATPATAELPVTTDAPAPPPSAAPPTAAPPTPTTAPAAPIPDAPTVTPPPTTAPPTTVPPTTTTTEPPPTTTTSGAS